MIVLRIMGGLYHGMTVPDETHFAELPSSRPFTTTVSTRTVFSGTTGCGMIEGMPAMGMMIPFQQMALLAVIGLGIIGLVLWLVLRKR